MDSVRAKQIMDSLGVIEVTYNGLPVWIENIRGNEAEVTFLETKKRTQVTLDTLTENGINNI